MFNPIPKILNTWEADTHVCHQDWRSSPQKTAVMRTKMTATMTMELRIVKEGKRPAPLAVTLTSMTRCILEGSLAMRPVEQSKLDVDHSVARTAKYDQVWNVMQRLWTVYLAFCILIW